MWLGGVPLDVLQPQWLGYIARLSLSILQVYTYVHIYLFESSQSYTAPAVMIPGLLSVKTPNWEQETDLTTGTYTIDTFSSEIMQSPQITKEIALLTRRPNTYLHHCYYPVCSSRTGREDCWRFFGQTA